MKAIETVNNDGVVLLPDYMAKAVMSSDNIANVAEVEDRKLVNDLASTQMFEKSKELDIK